MVLPCTISSLKHTLVERRPAAIELVIVADDGFPFIRGDADGLEAEMSKFPKDFGPDVEVEEVDLDTADVRYRGKKLTEARAAEVAADILSRTPGRPSLSGASEKSPSLTIRLPKQDRARLEHVAAKQGRRASEVVREALDDYLSRHAG